MKKLMMIFLKPWSCFHYFVLSCFLPMSTKRSEITGAQDLVTDVDKIVMPRVICQQMTGIRLANRVGNVPGPKSPKVTKKEIVTYVKTIESSSVEKFDACLTKIVTTCQSYKVLHAHFEEGSGASKAYRMTLQITLGRNKNV